LAAIVDPVTSGQAARDYLAQVVNPTLLKGLTELCKQKPQCPVVSGLPVTLSLPDLFCLEI